MLNPWNPYEQHTCPDCGVLEGQIHEGLCDQERCPFCGGQLLSCLCKYEHLNLIDRDKYTEATYYLPPDIFSHGLSEAQWEQWETILADKGYVPYICYPIFCGRCGIAWPTTVMFPDDEWECFIQKDARHLEICEDCYYQIANMQIHAVTGIPLPE